MFRERGVVPGTKWSFPAVKRPHPAVAISEKPKKKLERSSFFGLTSFIPISERKRRSFFMKKRNVFALETLACLAVLTALQVVLSRFLSVPFWNLKFGFSFVPVLIAANLYGPLGAAAVYGVGDLVGALLFPQGTYFPGFTLSAVLSGIIWGIFLKGKIKPGKAIVAVVAVQIFCSFLMNSYWISFISGAPFSSLLATRWPQSLAYAALHLVFIFLFLGKIGSLVKKIMKQV